MAGALADAEALESSLTEAVGVQNSTSFDPLIDLLKKISRLLSEQVERRGLSRQAESPPEEATAEPAARGLECRSGRTERHDREFRLGVRDGGAPPVAADEVRSRDDVIRLIDKICDYYRDYEPSSPVPLLLKRAKRRRDDGLPGVASRIGAQRFAGG